MFGRRGDALLCTALALLSFGAANDVARHDAVIALLVAGAGGLALFAAAFILWGPSSASLRIGENHARQASRS